MRQEYPELSQYEDLKRITDYQMRFCWYMGCQSSPYIDVQEDVRVSKTLKTLKEFTATLSPRDIDNYMKRNYPNGIAEGINIFKGFRATMRERAVVMAEKLLTQMEVVTHITVEGDVLTDYGKLKQLIDAKRIAYILVPQLIEGAEGAYGIKKVAEKEGEKEEISLLERVSQQ